MPSPAFFCGFIKHMMDIWDNGDKSYVPRMLRFLEGEDWASAEAGVKEKINRSIAHWGRVAKEMLLKAGAMPCGREEG
jgi:hypothetical protein